MPAYFTVVQCVPDPVADERINVGVIVFDGGQIRSRFLRDWRRVSRFADEDLGYVREFADRVERAALESTGRGSQPPIPGLPGPQRLDEATLRSMIQGWSNSIQLTPPQVSLEEPEALLDSLAITFLREPVARQGRFRDRQDAARLAVKVAREAVVHRIGATAAERVLGTPYQLAGRVVPRLKVDLAVKNGRVYVATRALSFETHQMSDLDEQIRETLYTLKDVGERHPQVRLDLVALPPKEDSRGYREARERFREVESSCRTVGITLVPESETLFWAEGIAEIAERHDVATGWQAVRA